jgi:serine phosphatase RsbU (regulator of sigma subunit)/DNA-binding CsgD family transcriptional regulator
VEVLLTIGEEYEYLSLDSSLHYYELCIASCDKGLKNKPYPILYEFKSTALSDLGYTYSQKGDLSNALKNYELSLKMDSASENYEYSGTTLDNIGAVLYDLGKVELSLEYAQKGLKLREDIGDRGGIAISYNNIGYTYHNHIGNMDLGLEYYTKSNEIFKELEDREGQTHALNNMGFVHYQKKEFLIAQKHFNRSLQLAKELESSALSIAPLINIAQIFDDNGSPDSSLYYFNKVLEIANESELLDRKAFVLNNIGWVYYNMGATKKAIENAQAALLIAKKEGYKGIEKNANDMLYQSYNRLNDKAKAYKYFKEFISIRDSLTTKSSIQKTIKSQYKYEYEKTALADSLKNVEEKRIAEVEYNQEIEKQKTYSYIGVIGFVLMLLISGLIFRSYRAKKKANSIIFSQKIEVEEQRDIANIQKIIVEEKNKEILDSITYAKRIQEAILPPPRLVKEWLTESFIFYKPKDIVAGDFYWMETATFNENNKEKTLVYFAAADCTGHGVPGAMVSVVCANALNRAIKEFNLIEPGQVLDKVTELVVESFDKGDEDIKDGMDIALCALDISAKKVFYSGANNPLYRITSIKEKVADDIRTENNETHQLIEYKANKQPIGFNENHVSFNTIEIQLEPGDAIYVFSDGFPDQFGGAKGKKYKYSTFRKSLLANFHHPMETQKQMLETDFDNWKGELEQIDDVCVIGVRINGKEKNNFTKRELEVLIHLKEGLSSKLIADRMSISKHTVDTYRRRLLAKTGSYNATELISYCIKKEII